MIKQKTVRIKQNNLFKLVSIRSHATVIDVFYLYHILTTN